MLSYFDEEITNLYDIGLTDLVKSKTESNDNRIRKTDCNTNGFEELIIKYKL